MTKAANRMPTGRYAGMLAEMAGLVTRAESLVDSALTSQRVVKESRPMPAAAMSTSPGVVAGMIE